MQVGLYDLRGKAPAVLHVPLVEDGEGPTACELASVLPLEAVLTPVALDKETLTAAIDGLEPAAGPGGILSSTILGLVSPFTLPV